MLSDSSSARKLCEPGPGARVLRSGFNNFMLSLDHNDVILRVAKILEDLGPFPKTAPRHQKWRTTEQLANALWHSDAHLHLEELDQLLTQYEAEYRDQLKRGINPVALIRRAVYPDRTTALPLWGATVHHGQPWLSQSSGQRADPPEDFPDLERVPESAPHVFLSHASGDSSLAGDIARTLAAKQIGTWMFESNIGYGQNIASCVRSAISECACCAALVTRESIASLWVLTELHSALNIGKPCLFFLDASDGLLLELMRSLSFHDPSGMFDLSVEYDKTVLVGLEGAYAKLQNRASRVDRYQSQVHDFLATLPLYLNHFAQPAFAFPRLPQIWSGPLVLSDFGAVIDQILRF